MKFYHALVHKDADSAYGVTFPDLPGCFSAADTMEDILPNAVEALELWFEDADAVTPSPLERIRDLVSDDLAAGAFIVAVPFISPTGKMMRVNISMDRGVIEAIDAAASAKKMTRSGFMAQAARNEIEGRH